MSIRVLHRLRDRYVEFQAGAGIQNRWGPIIGIVGYPAFYILWEYGIRQPYNSVVASGIAFAGSLLLGVFGAWPGWLKRHVMPLRYLITVYNLPFFFTFMLLMNGSNATWQLSCMGGFIYLLLLSDALNAVAMSIVGIAAACLLHYVVSVEAGFGTDFLITLTTIAFVMSGYALLARRDSIAYNQRLRGAELMASAIAHELRTPLAGLRLDAAQCSRLLPLLVEAHRWAEANGWQAEPGPSPRLSELPRALARIHHQARSADTIINMVLTSVVPVRGALNDELIDVDRIIRVAVDSYPLRDDQRHKVRLDLGGGFSVLGSDTVLRHVILNLLKNALRALDQRDGGDIVIRTGRDRGNGYINVIDTGIGIRDQDMPFLFIPFYTLQARGQGTGVGLAFCKHVIETMNGSIRCTSKFGRGTEFEITLPVAAGPKPISEPQAASSAAA